MGRGNIRPDGKYEGVVYIDYDNVLCYTKKDDFEQRLLKDISYEEMPEFEFDDDASQLLLDEYRTNLVNEMMRRYQSFEEAKREDCSKKSTVLKAHKYSTFGKILSIRKTQDVGISRPICC